MEDREPMNETNLKIKAEIYDILFEHGADSSILAAVGSWKETLSDKTTLMCLKKRGKFDTIFDKSEEVDKFNNEQHKKRVN